MAKKLPSTIFVAHRTEGSDTFMIADTDIESFEHDEVVGTYRLTSLGKKRITHGIVPRKAP